jgi:hypothetical protein
MSLQIFKHPSGSTLDAPTALCKHDRRRLCPSPKETSRSPHKSATRIRQTTILCLGHMNRAAQSDRIPRELQTRSRQTAVAYKRKKREGEAALP